MQWLRRLRAGTFNQSSDYAELLVQAKSHQQNHEWQEAIALYKRILGKNKRADSSIYVSFARLLRLHSFQEVDRAELMLKRAVKLYPKNEDILSELYNLYYARNKWEDAKKVAEELIKINPVANNYFKLGRASAWHGEDLKAKSNFIKGLELKHKKSLDEIKEIIKKQISGGDLKSSYEIIGGKNNYGVFVHEQKGQKRLFTKISENKTSIQNEEFFYAKITVKHPKLKRIAPKYVDCITIDGMQYMTLEYIKGRHPTRSHVESVINAARQISSIKVSALEKLGFQQQRRSFTLTSRLWSAVQFFTQIHRKHRNVQLLKSLRKQLRKSSAPAKATKIVDRLEKFVLGNELYKYMNPSHYTLLHGDLDPTNILIDSKGKVKIVDWASITHGPSFLDQARFICTAVIPFERVKKLKFYSQDLSDVERIFFLYACIVMHMITGGAMDKQAFMNVMKDHVQPTLSEMERLVDKFNGNTNSSH